MIPQISGLVVTLNEARSIGRCITSLRQICSEIVVLDSGSTDNTTTIAKSLGAKVVSHRWLGHGAQRNLGLHYCSNAWVFSLDADEEISVELAASVTLAFKNEVNDSRAFAVARKNYIGANWIKHSGWYPDIVIRLFNKNLHQFLPRAVHESLMVSRDNVSVLDGAIHHYSYDSTEQLSERAKTYASIAAVELAQSSKQLHIVSPLVHGAAGFLKKYILQGGVFNGATGLAIALARYQNAYFKYKHALEIRREKPSSNQ